MTLERLRSRAQRRARGEYRTYEHVRPGVCFLQDDLVVANAAGAAVRADINNQLQALGTLMSGATGPATAYSYMLWADTTSNTLKRRNAANSAWIVVRSLDESFVLSRASNTLLDISDLGKTIRATGSFTQTFDPCATLADGWWVDYINEGSGTITLDPNASETIDGATTLALRAGESCRIVCNGANLKRTLVSRLAGVIATGRNITARTDATIPNSKINIAADELQLKDSSGNVFLATSVSETADITVAGANGLDTGSEASSTWYYGWIIAKDDGTVDSLLSASSSAPTLPSGYTYKALVSTVRNDGASNFIKYRQFGNRVYYEAAQSVLAGGGATTETSVTISGAVPSIAQCFAVSVYGTATSTANNPADFSFRIRHISGSEYARARTNDSTEASGNSNSHGIGFTAEVPNTGLFYLWVVESGALGSADGNIAVMGFKLPMGGE